MDTSLPARGSHLHALCRNICDWDQNWIQAIKALLGGQSRDWGDLQTAKINRSRKHNCNLTFDPWKSSDPEPQKGTINRSSTFCGCKRFNRQQCLPLGLQAYFMGYVHRYWHEKLVSYLELKSLDMRLMKTSSLRISSWFFSLYPDGGFLAGSKSVVTPQEVSKADLLMTHSQRYLTSLNVSVPWPDILCTLQLTWCIWVSTEDSLKTCLILSGKTQQCPT